MKIDLALRELHRSETALAKTLLSVAERHKVEHEIHHVARDLAAWSRAHVTELAEAGNRYGVELEADPPEDAGVFGFLQAKLSEAVGNRPEPGMLLLADLRRLHLKAAGVSVDWEFLGQAAQAAKDRELLELTKRCHPHTVRQMKWANTMIKTVSPQVLMS